MQGQFGLPNLKVLWFYVRLLRGLQQAISLLQSSLIASQVLQVGRKHLAQATIEKVSPIFGLASYDQQIFDGEGHGGDSSHNISGPFQPVPV